jgi:hypothetical protein
VNGRIGEGMINSPLVVFDLCKIRRHATGQFFVEQNHNGSNLTATVQLDDRAWPLYGHNRDRLHK